MVEDTAKVIVEAAKSLLKDTSSQAAYSQLVGATFGLIDRGIASVTTAYDGRVDAEEMLTRFLHEKIDNPKFLSGIVGASEAEGYVVQAAKNFTRDSIRTNPPVAFETSGDAKEGPTRELFVDDSLSAEEEIVASQEQAHRMQWLGELPVDDQLLMHILYAEALELPQSMLVLLAKRRAVDAAAIKREIEGRATAQQGKRTEWERELNSRSETIYSVQHRTRIVSAMISECDYQRAEVPAQLSAERREELRQNQRALKAASAQERSGYVAHLEARLERLSSLQQETRVKLAKEFPAGQRYEEALSILGQLPEGVNDRKKAINAVTTRLRRIRKKLRQRMAAEGQEP